MNAAGQNNSNAGQIWTTFIALAYMSLALAQLQTSWMLVAKKAENGSTLKIWRTKPLARWPHKNTLISS